MSARFARLLPLALASVACAGSRPDRTDQASADSTPAPAPAPNAPAPWTITPDHIGPVRIGSSVADMNTVLGDSLLPTYQASDQCDHLTPSAFPAGTRVMIERDTVVRAEVDSAGVKTAEGAGVGDTEASLLARYGPRATVTPHKYTGPEGHYVTVTTPSDSTRLTIFETDGKIVLRFRAGIRPAVAYIEGCS